MTAKGATVKTRTRIIQTFALIFGIFLALMNAPMASADTESSGSPYFIDGYDVVSYFRDSGPVEGNLDFSTNYEEKILLFSSEKNLADFVATPEDFMPAYNGYCAYGMVYGMKSGVDPLQYDIVDGRLYLQLNGGTKNRWNRRVSRYIKKSDRVWKSLTAPEEARR